MQTGPASLEASGAGEGKMAVQISLCSHFSPPLPSYLGPMDQEWGGAQGGMTFLSGLAQGKGSSIMPGAS
jgi:hypothetical protein